MLTNDAKEVQATIQICKIAFSPAPFFVTSSACLASDSNMHLLSFFASFCWYMQKSKSQDREAKFIEFRRCHLEKSVQVILMIIISSLLARPLLSWGPIFLQLKCSRNIKRWLEIYAVPGLYICFDNAFFPHHYPDPLTQWAETKPGILLSFVSPPPSSCLWQKNIARIANALPVTLYSRVTM